MLCFLVGYLPMEVLALDCDVRPVVGQYIFERPGMMITDSRGDYVFVADEDAGNLTVIDTAQTAAVASIEVAPHPVGLALDAVNKRLYVSHANRGDNAFDNENLSVVELDASHPSEFRLLEKRVVSPYALNAMVYDSHFKRLFVSVFKPGELDEILILKPDLSPVGSLPSPDRRSDGAVDMVIHAGKLYVAYDTGRSVGVYHITSAEPVLSHVISLPGQARAMTLSDDGNTLYVSTGVPFGLEGHVVLIDTLTDEEKEESPVEHLNLLNSPHGLAYLDGRLWIANQGGGDLAEYEARHTQDLLPSTCKGLSGLMPGELLAVPGRGQIYVALGGSVDVLLPRRVKARLCRQRDGNMHCDTDYTVRVAPGEQLELHVEGGVGPFGISTSGGTQLVQLSNREWQVRAPLVAERYSLVVHDEGYGGSYDAITLEVGDVAEAADPPPYSAEVRFLGEAEQHYQWGDRVTVDLREVNRGDRFSRADLWIAVLVRRSGEMYFKTPYPLYPFMFEPQAFRFSIQEAELIHRILELEVIPGMEGEYVFYALYTREQANPVTDGLETVARSNLAMQVIVLGGR